MTYTLYTYPNCHTCHDVKEVLAERGIEYSEANLGSKEGLKELRVLAADYKKSGGVLERDKNKMLLLPILVESNGQGIERLVQGEDVIELFKPGSSTKQGCPEDCVYFTAD